jgi:hypothetical protein
VPGEYIANFEKLVAPLELPGELRRLWERLNPATLAVAPRPDSAEAMSVTEFADPAFSWWAYRRQVDHPGLVPEILLCVSAGVGRFRFVELAGPHGEGGMVYEWHYGGSAFRPCFGSIAAWLGALADGLREDPQTVGERGAAMAWVDPATYAERARLPDVPPIGPEPEAWPDSWKAAARMFDGRRRPKPADRSISELLSESAERRVTATIEGVVERRLWGDRGTRMLVCDGTGLLDAWCAATVGAEWLLRSQRTFEVDVVAGPGLEPPQLESSRWIDRAMNAAPPQAHVTGLRPLLFG